MKTNKIWMKAGWILMIVIILTFISGCANNESVEACLTGQKYGFWSGLLHGIIAPIDFVMMLFKENYTIYAQNNNGAWYAFGFLLGSGGWGFLGGKGLGRRRRRKDY